MTRKVDAAILVVVLGLKAGEVSLESRLTADGGQVEEASG